MWQTHHRGGLNYPTGLCFNYSGSIDIRVNSEFIFRSEGVPPFLTDWNFYVDNDMIIPADTFIGGDTDINGTLNADGNATINLYYGEMYNYTANATAWTFPIGVAGVYYNMTNLTAGNLNGITFSNVGESRLTVIQNGTYKVDAAISIEATANNQLYSFVVSKNADATISRNCYSRRFVSTQAAVGSASITCFLDLVTNDYITLQIENEAGNADIRIHAINVNMVRIGT